MGNRFRALTEYHTIIKAHAAIACIIFLFLIPTAITTVRFYQKNRRLAKRVHIWINILVVFLITVVLILGWFAVGPERSLTNPHHGIGVALYTLVLVQVIGGAIVRHMEKWKDRDYIPVKIMVRPCGLRLTSQADLSTVASLDGKGNRFTRSRTATYRIRTVWLPERSVHHVCPDSSRLDNIVLCAFS